MKNVSHRIGCLEFRKTSTIGGEQEYYEIVRWDKHLDVDKTDEPDDYCYTIATFEKDKEGYDLESIGSRIVLEREEWVDFGVLVKIGFEFLEKEFQEEGVDE